MKNVFVLISALVISSHAFAIDLKGKIIEAAKDKENQEMAKEYAQKAIDYIKKDKNEEVKATPEPTTPAANDIKESKSKKTVKKKSVTKKGK